jgi:hypothetical protein
VGQVGRVGQVQGPGEPAGLDAAWRRFTFVAWPQAHAHPTWIALLAQRLALPPERAEQEARLPGHEAGAVARAWASALLAEVGERRDAGTADGWVPAWLVLPLSAMRAHLSVIAASLLSEPLARTSGTEAVQRLEAVLGAGVRRAALLLARQHGADQDDASRSELQSAAQKALAEALSTATSEPWDRFCLRLGLSALDAGAATQRQALQARLRLVWPEPMARHAQPLALASAFASAWLAQRSEHGTQVQVQA